MKTNFTHYDGCMTGYEPSDTFVKAKDIELNDYGRLYVRGLFSHDKSKFGISYALVCEDADSKDIININIPSWLGKAIEKDFISESNNPDLYFKGAFIAGIEPISTPNGMSVNIEFATDNGGCV